MKILIYFMLCLTWSLASFAQTNPVIKSCVLYYERAEHPFAAQIKKIFKGHSEVALVMTATPADLVKCVEENNPEEVLIFAHAFQVDNSSMRLGFFLPQSEEATTAAFNAAVKDMSDMRNKVISQPGFTKCFPPSPHSAPCTPNQKLEESLRLELAKMRNMKKSDDVYKLVFGYSKGLFFQKPFDDLYALARTKALNLKKIRLMSCEPKQIYNAYPSLKALVYDFKLTLDVAPTSKILSLFDGHNVTTIDDDWLAKSL